MSAAAWLAGALPTRQKTTSRELGGINPAWFTGPIINPKTKRKISGTPWGHYATFPAGGRLWLPGIDEEAGSEFLNFGRGEMFFFDQREFLRANRLVHNLNTVIVGEIDMQKSAGLKILIIRGTKSGYRYLVIDPKGEYGPLVESIPGAVEIKFGKDTGYFLNPLDPILSIESGQIPLVSRLALIAMGHEKRHHSELEGLEHSLVEAAVMDANQHYLSIDGRPTPVPTLPDVVGRLDAPNAWMRNHIAAKKKDIAAGGLYHEKRIALARALSRYTKGDMMGMFHRETSPGVYKEAPLVVMNCKHLEGPHQTAVVVLLQTLTTNKLGQDNTSRKFDEVIVDESWKLSRDRRFVDVQVEGLKLGRSEDIAFTWALHNLKDQERASYGYEATTGLINDCAFRFIYNQSDQELENSAVALGVDNPRLKWLIPRLPPGVAVLQAGKNLPPYLVKQYAMKRELPLLETSGVNKSM
jgi:hypothetical protein